MNPGWSDLFEELSLVRLDCFVATLLAMTGRSQTVDRYSGYFSFMQASVSAISASSTASSTSDSFLM